MRKFLFKLFIFSTGFVSSTFLFDYTNIPNRLHNQFKQYSAKFYGYPSTMPCNFVELKQIPKNSTVVIGHAYGSQSKSLKRSHIGIAPSVKNFMDRNLSKIDTLVFTGDVFSIPSLEKWNNLYQTYSNYFDIYIAPGNHDVGSERYGGFRDTSQRDIYNSFMKNKQPLSEPFLIKRQGFDIIIEDSTLYPNNKNNKSFQLSQSRIKDLLKTRKIETKNTIIRLRHHKAIDMDQPYRSTDRIKYLSQEFDRFGHSYLIYGNSHGLECFNYRKMTHIENGIGENKNDYIIVLHNKNIYTFNIGSSYY